MAKKTSEYYKTDHHEFLVSGRDAAANLFDVVYHLDEPVANATQIATYLLSKHAGKQVAVVLGGDGGDELFGGYERYRLSQFISGYQKMPLAFRKSFGTFFINLFKNKYPAIEKFNFQGAERYLSFMAQKGKDVSLFINDKYYNNRVAAEFYQERYFKEKINDFEKQFMWADIRSWLPDESLSRSDKMSMAFGLEQRVPILDHRLVELSLRIPTKWKIKGKDKKSIFKQAMREYIPDYVWTQPKRGWFSPTSAWMRNELKDLVYEVLSPQYSPATQEWFNFEKIKIMLDDHIECKKYNMNLLWALITFQIWHKQFIK